MLVLFNIFMKFGDFKITNSDAFFITHF